MHVNYVEAEVIGVESVLCVLCARWLRRINETPAASATHGSGAQSSAQTSTAGMSTVRRIQIVDLDEMDEPDGEASTRMVSTEEYDMTCSDDGRSVEAEKMVETPALGSSWGGRRGRTGGAWPKAKGGDLCERW